MVNRSQCTLGAFIRVLEYIAIGFQISDTHFFNFGVRFFSDFATEHVVVMIDAGSRGWHPNARIWSKGEVDQKTMKNFWSHAKKHDALDPDLVELWRSHEHRDVGSALAAAQAKWAKSPMLTDEPVRLQDILESRGHTAQQEAREMTTSKAYEIINCVARH